LTKLHYKRAGVDIDAGEAFVEKIKPLVQTTFRRDVLTGLGGFAGLFALNAKKFNEPVLVSGTDGVGTKLKIAFLANRHNTIGIDLVAMCVNDIVVTGATPLFFLDYLACGKLIPEKMKRVVQGIVTGCHQAGCALIGGETAEMPSLYRAGEYDLAGFAVGVVEKKKILDGRHIRKGDLLIGMASSGFHSNGFSLVRKVFLEQEGFDLKERLPGFTKSLGTLLLTPTLIYAKTLLKIIKKFQIKGVAHITGGGITRNLPRIFPEGFAARVVLGRWPVPPIFTALQKMGQIDLEEMYTCFNMGIGMIVVAPQEASLQILADLKKMGQAAWVIGEVVRGTTRVLYADE